MLSRALHAPHALPHPHPARRQDEDLEQLSTHVVRIGELGKEMGQELHLQGQLLDELDAEIDGTSTRIQAAQVGGGAGCGWGREGGWRLRRSAMAGAVVVAMATMFRLPALRCPRRAHPRRAHPAVAPAALLLPSEED